MRNFYLLALVLLITFSAKGQKMKTAAADKYYQDYQFLAAAQAYEQIIKADAKNVAVMEKLVQCYTRLNNPVKSEFWLGKVLKNPQTEPKSYKTFATLLAANGKYAEASRWFDKSYQETKDQESLRWLNTYQNLQQFYADSALYQITKVTFNSRHADFSPAFYDQGVVFSSNRENGKYNKLKFDYNNTWFIDLYFVKDSLSKPVPFSDVLNSKYHEGPLSFTPDQKTVYFTRNNYLKKNVFSSDGVSKLKIYFASVYNGHWGQIREFLWNNNEYSVGQPALASDNLMYFVSDMPGGFGGTDLYRTERVNEVWQKPVNMGPEINTTGNEMFPYVDELGILYFASNGHPGLGGLDVFYAAVSGRDLSPVRNLGYPVNTARDDFGFIIRNNHGYFSSNRKGETNNDDIYRFKLNREHPIMGIARAKEETGKDEELTQAKVNSDTLARASNQLAALALNQTEKQEINGIAKETQTSAITKPENLVLTQAQQAADKQQAANNLLPDAETGIAGEPGTQIPVTASLAGMPAALVEGTDHPGTPAGLPADLQDDFLTGEGAQAKDTAATGNTGQQLASPSSLAQANPDITNPDITNPDITNPDITNPDIADPITAKSGEIAEATTPGTVSTATEDLNGQQNPWAKVQGKDVFKRQPGAGEEPAAGQEGSPEAALIADSKAGVPGSAAATEELIPAEAGIIADSKAVIPGAGAATEELIPAEAAIIADSKAGASGSAAATEELPAGTSAVSPITPAANEVVVPGAAATTLAGSTSNLADAGLAGLPDLTPALQASESYPTALSATPAATVGANADVIFGKPNNLASTDNGESGTISRDLNEATAPTTNEAGAAPDKMTRLKSLPKAFKTGSVGEVIELEIKYDLDKTAIRSDAVAVLNELVSYMKRNPNVKVELGAHTDIRGADGYNQWLSQGRAESVMDYVARNGISRDRLIAVGFGEKDLAVVGALNEAEHQLNRRTTAKIFSNEEQLQAYHKSVTLPKLASIREKLEQEQIQLAEKQAMLAAAAPVRKPGAHELASEEVDTEASWAGADRGSLAAGEAAAGNKAAAAREADVNSEGSLTSFATPEEVGLNSPTPFVNIQAPATAMGQVPDKQQQVRTLAATEDGVEMEVAVQPKAPAPVKTRASAREMLFWNPKATTPKAAAAQAKINADIFFIIANAFLSLEEAEVYQQEVLALGADSRIIMPFAGSKLYRVAVADYNNNQEAQRQLPVKKQTFGDHSWVLGLNSGEFTTRRLAPALPVAGMADAGHSLLGSPASAEVTGSLAAAQVLKSANALIADLEARIATLETRLVVAESEGKAESRYKNAAYSPKTLIGKFTAGNAHRASARLLAEVAPFAVDHKTGRHYIISGSFSTLGTANWYRKKMARMGGDAKIILPNPENRLYMVTVADYENLKESRLKLPGLKRTFGLYIWIKNF